MHRRGHKIAPEAIMASSCENSDENSKHGGRYKQKRRNIQRIKNRQEKSISIDLYRDTNTNNRTRHISKR